MATLNMKTKEQALKAVNGKLSLIKEDMLFLHNLDIYVEPDTIAVSFDRPMPNDYPTRYQATLQVAHDDIIGAVKRGVAYHLGNLYEELLPILREHEDVVLSEEEAVLIREAKATYYNIIGS